MQGKFAPQPPSFGFELQVSIPVNGSVELNGVQQADPRLVLNGKLELNLDAVKLATIGCELSMTGMWRKAFGIQFLGIADIRIK